MATPYWSAQHLGCIDRDSFQLRPMPRTALTQSVGPPTKAKRADVAAPITAQITAQQTFAQWTAFTQWYRVDLAGGALPFAIDLWLWDRVRRVRARFVNPWRVKRDSWNALQLSATIEIERESIA